MKHLPPFAAPNGFTNALQPKGEKKTLWFVFAGDQLLVNSDKQSVPCKQPIELKRILYMGTFGNIDVFAGEAANLSHVPEGLLWMGLRSLFGTLNEDDFALAGRAKQLIEWDRTHAFCGCCGKETFTRENERCRECLSCGHLAYPKLAPVTITLVKKEKEILLVKGTHFKGDWYSLVAGFVEPGETLEQCVAREISEEVGIKVKNIYYFGSQPWPFSNALMIAFTADWESGEIAIDPKEISTAGWFDIKNLPPLPPPLSLSRILIDSMAI